MPSIHAAFEAIRHGQNLHAAASETELKQESPAPEGGAASAGVVLGIGYVIRNHRPSLKVSHSASAHMGLRFASHWLVVAEYAFRSLDRRQDQAVSLTSQGHDVCLRLVCDWRWDWFFLGAEAGAALTLLHWQATSEVADIRAHRAQTEATVGLGAAARVGVVWPEWLRLTTGPGLAVMVLDRNFVTRSEGDTSQVGRRQTVQAFWMVRLALHP